MPESLSTPVHPRRFGRLFLPTALVVAGCGGGSGGSAPTASVPLTVTLPHARFEGAVGVPLVATEPTLSSPTTSELWSITPALPAGLQLDASSGIVVGTPTERSIARTYTLSVDSSAGTAEAELVLRISDPSRVLFVGSAADGSILAGALDAPSGAASTVFVEPADSNLPPLEDLVVLSGEDLAVAVHGDGSQDGVLVVHDLSGPIGLPTERGRALLGRGPHRIARDGARSVVHITSAGDDRVESFDVSGPTPSPLGAPVGTGREPSGAAVVGDVLVVANRLDRSLTSITLDGSTGAPLGVQDVLSLNGGLPGDVDGGLADDLAFVSLENFAIAIAIEVDPATGDLATTFGGAAVGLGASAVAVHPSGEFALVMNTLENTVSVAGPTAPDTGGRRLVELATISVGDCPLRAAFDAAGRFAYVACDGSDEVTILRVELSPVAVTAVGTLAVRDGVRALATREGDAPLARRADRLHVLDPIDSTVTSFALDADPAAPAALGSPLFLGAASAVTLDPRSATLFVASSTAEEIEALPVDTLNRAPSTGTTSATQGRPVALAATATGRHLIVASTSPPSLATLAIDRSTRSLTQVDSLALPGVPTAVAVDPAGRFVVVAIPQLAELAVYAVDLEGRLNGPLDVRGGIAFPRTLRFAPHGRSIATALEDQDRVALFDLGANGTLTPTAPAAPFGDSVSDAPASVAFSPSGERLAVASAGADSLDVVDLEGGAANGHRSTVVGLGPIDAQYAPGSDLVYVLNGAGSDLAIVRDGEVSEPLTTVPLGSGPSQFVVTTRWQ